MRERMYSESEYQRTFQRVLDDLGVPPRGKRGSPENIRRMRMMGKVHVETLRRLRAKGKDAPFRNEGHD